MHMSEANSSGTFKRQPLPSHHFSFYGLGLLSRTLGVGSWAAGNGGTVKKIMTRHSPLPTPHTSHRPKRALSRCITCLTRGKHDSLDIGCGSPFSYPTLRISILRGVPCSVVGEAHERELLCTAVLSYLLHVLVLSDSPHAGPVRHVYNLLLVPSLPR